MVLRRHNVERALKELDAVLQELAKYRDVTLESFTGNLSTRWAVERGLIAGASLVFDVTDHILGSHFGVYADTYEDSLAELHKRGVITDELFAQVKGLGGFRNTWSTGTWSSVRKPSTDTSRKALGSSRFSPARCFCGLSAQRHRPNRTPDGIAHPLWLPPRTRRAQRPSKAFMAEGLQQGFKKS
jgi:uncharacterized protein YutE (UPF0331/DUF86 family)